MLNDRPGVLNVAAEGVPLLSRFLALPGTWCPGLLHSIANAGGGLVGAHQPDLDRSVPIPLEYLRHSWVADLIRMRDELGFAPKLTGEEAVRHFAAQYRAQRHPSPPELRASDERHLRKIIRRRQQDRTELADASGRQTKNG